MQCDSTSIVVGSSVPDGHTHLAVVDVRTGAERDGFDLPDSSIANATTIPNGWAWIPIARDRLIVEQHGKRRRQKLPDWYSNVNDVFGDPAHGRLFVKSFNRSNGDTIGVAAVDVSTGTFTQWASMFALDVQPSLLDGGDVLLAARRSEDAYELYRLSGPRTMKRLGSPSVPLFLMSVLGDLKRATAVQPSYDADAWMYNVVKR